MAENDPTFTFYWRTGNREVLRGRTVAEAANLAGYGGGAIRALDFYADGDCRDYEWDASAREWRKIAA